MALLGKRWNKITNITVALATGGAAAGVHYAGVAHELGVVPDLVLPIVKSVSNPMQVGPVLAVGGNASQATYGVCLASVASAPTICLDVHAVYVWAPVR